VYSYLAIYPTLSLVTAGYVGQPVWTMLLGRQLLGMISG
jgi:hypothetical protein